MPDTRSTTEGMASIRQGIADLSKMVDQLLKNQEKMRTQRAHMAETLEQIQSSVDELLPVSARAGKQSILEPDNPPTTEIVEQPQNSDRELQMASVRAGKQPVNETTTAPDSPLLATPTDQALSESSKGIIPHSGQPLQLQDVVSSEPNAGANNRVPQVEVPSLFATDSLSILMLNDAEISEESFGTKLDVSNTVSDLCPLPVCENAAAYLSSIPLAHKTFNGNWCSMQVFYIAAVYLKPPWEPPDDRTRCELKLMSLPMPENDGIENISRVGKWNKAVSLLAKMQMGRVSPDVITYYSLIYGFSVNGKWEEVRAAFVDYVEESGIEIEERACMVLLLALKRADQVDMSLKFFCQMVDANVPIAVYSMAITVDGLCRKGETDQARVLIDDMSCLGFKGNAYSYNTLICAYIKTGDFVGVDEKEAAERLAGVLNDGSFYSIKGKNKHRLWWELCDLLTKHVTEVSGLNVDAIIRGGIRRFTDEVGRLGTSLADYYIRRNQTGKARDVVSEGMTTVVTVRDFSVIFYAYSQFEESMLALRMENIDLDDLSIWWKISGVFTSSQVKIVDGNFVYDKGKGHKYNKKNDLKTYEHLGQDIGELKLVLCAFPHELNILLGCKDVLLKLAWLVKPPPLPPEICHNRSSHIGNDVSVSEEKASRRPFEVLSNPNCLDGLQTYSHLLVLYISGEFVTAYGIVSRLPKPKPCYSYELLNANLIHEALLSSQRQIFTPLTYNAYVVFDCMPVRNSVSWNALIAGYAELGEYEMVIQLLGDMEREGVRIDDVTLVPLLALLNYPSFRKSFCNEHGLYPKTAPSSIVYSCRVSEDDSLVEYNDDLDAKKLKAFCLDHSPRFSKRVDVSNLDISSSTWSKLPRVVLLSTKKDTPVIWRVLSGLYRKRFAFYDAQVDDASNPSVKRLGVNALPAVVGWLSNGEKHILKTGIHPDVVTWNTLIDYQCKFGHHNRVKELLEEMQRSGRLPCMINSLGQQEGWNDVKTLLGNMQSKGLLANVVTYTALVDIYGKSGRFNEAIECLEVIGLLLNLVNKFFIFSLPRPPEADNLEDKVILKEGVMLHIQISRSMGT